MIRLFCAGGASAPPPPVPSELAASTCTYGQDKRSRKKGEMDTKESYLGLIKLRWKNMYIQVKLFLSVGSCDVVRHPPKYLVSNIAICIIKLKDRTKFYGDAEKGEIHRLSHW